MEKEFVPHEQSLDLKELGFNEDYLGFYFFNGSSNRWVLETKEYQDEYSKTISAPTFSQAFRFFNEKYGLNHYNIRRDYYISEDGVRSYDDIELECLKKLIEIVKEKK